MTTPDTTTRHVARTRPFGELLGNVVVLLLLVVLAALLILAAKQVADTRIDRQVVRDVMAMRDQVYGETGFPVDADGFAAEAVRLRPRIAAVVARAYLAEAEVVPQLADAVARAADGIAQPWSPPEYVAVWELLLRSGRAIADFPAEGLPLFTAFVGQTDAVTPSQMFSLEEAPFLASGPKVASNPGATDWPEGGEGHYAQGLVNLLRGDVAVARERLFEAWRMEVYPGDTAYWLGVCFEQGGQPEQAVQWYERAVKQGDNHLAAAQCYLRLVRAVTMEERQSP